MPTLIESPAIIEPAGHPPKRIEEYAGRVNSGHDALSVARMVSPEGWREPGQRPVVVLDLEGAAQHQRDLQELGALMVRAGQAVVTHPGEWVRYCSPEPGGAEYVAVCLPAFSPDTVHRDPEE